MSRPRLRIVDSLLDLDVDSLEADVVRQRRAHLARYAKVAMAAALAICLAAGVRMFGESVVGGPEVEAAAAVAAPGTPSGADTSVRPTTTLAAEVLPDATERVCRFVVVKKRGR